jgi:uncharacterized protein (DUF2345 family)
MEEQFETTSNEMDEEAGGFASQISGENVTFGPGFAGVVAANQDVSMSNSGAFGIAAGHDMQLSDGGGFAIAVGNDLDLMNGGAFVLNVGGNLEVTNGGGLVSVGNQMTAQNSFFGVLISNQTTLESGSKVLLDTKQALALGGALGVFFALLSWLLRRK